MDFADKLVLITGGSSGIGLACARQLAQAGARVWLWARREELLRSALTELQSASNGGCKYCGSVCADVTDIDQVEKAIQTVTAEAGVPDILINSAGIQHPGRFQEMEVEIFKRSIEVNYLGTVYPTRCLVQGMMARGSGYIVNLSSIAGLVGVFGYTAYSGSKFAVRGFSDALRAEMRPYGIKVSIVYPPDTDTPGLEYENRFKPSELKLASSKVAGSLSADQVAREILQGIRRERYVIAPGSDAKIIHWLIGHVGNLAYPVVDLVYDWARKKVAQEKPD